MHQFCHAVREKCPNTEFFWSVFSCIWTEYGDLLENSLDCLSVFDHFVGLALKGLMSYHIKSNKVEEGVNIY